MPEPKLYDAVQRRTTLHGTVVKDGGPRSGHYRRHVDGPASPVVKLSKMKVSGRDMMHCGLVYFWPCSAVHVCAGSLELELESTGSLERGRSQ